MHHCYDDIISILSRHPFCQGFWLGFCIDMYVAVLMKRWTLSWLLLVVDVHSNPLVKRLLDLLKSMKETILDENSFYTLL